MSEFISWIEKPSKTKGKPDIYFLTAEQIFNNEKGKRLQKELAGDFIGHSAIRFFYDLPDTTSRGRLYEKECADFSTPSNFPAIITRAIKRGDFRGMGTPQGLLTHPAYAEYERVRQPAYAEYERVRQPAEAEYEKVTQTAEAEYQKVRQPAYAEYQKVRQTAYAEYEKVTQPAFWDLFSDPKNRAEAWK